MRALRTFLARLRGLVGRRAADHSLDQEIAAHLDEATDEYVRQGHSRDEARRLALRNFGGVAQIEDVYREHASFPTVEQLAKDARYAARALARTPGFSLVVLLVLAIGVGAIVTVFALLNAIVLRPLAYAQPDRLVVITHASKLRPEGVGLSSGLYFHYAQHAQSIESIGVYSNTVLNLQMPDSGVERVHVTFASATLFHVLDVTPALGRLFTEDDAKPGFMDMTWPVPVLLSHALWVDRFGSDPNIVGRTIRMNDNSRVVVGVLPKGFAFPDTATQIWMLEQPMPRAASFASLFNLLDVARLKPGASVESASAELPGVLATIEGVYPDATRERMNALALTPKVVSLKTSIVGDVGGVLWTLFGGMTLLLTIAVANVSTLFAVRAQQRQREVALRLALGARRSQVAQLFFIEAVMLSGAAAALGLLLAAGGLRAIIAFIPIELPRSGEIAIDAAAMAFAAVLAVAIAVFYGAIAVRRQGPATIADLLHGHATTGRARRFGIDPSLVAQTALALTLMVGSALMVKTYLSLSARALGFVPDHALTMEIGLPYREASHYGRTYAAVVGAIRTLPGVADASATSFVPLTATRNVFPVIKGQAPVAFKFFVPGYFQAMGTPILDGQSFAANEHVTEPHAVLVSAALARRLYPGETAIGKTVERLQRDGSPVTMGRDATPIPPFTIVGVVGDVREASLRDEPSEVVYVPALDPPIEPSIVPTEMTVVVRTHGDPLSLTASVKGAIEAADPQLSVSRARTLETIVNESRGTETFVGVLLLVAAIVALALGVVGIYGHVAHVVRHRTREIGVRVALGASRADVVRAVTSGSMRSALVGTAIGLGLAFEGSSLLRVLLFGVAPHDPLVMLIVTGALLVAGSMAALAGAARAADIAPISAMRVE